MASWLLNNLSLDRLLKYSKIFFTSCSLSPLAWSLLSKDFCLALISSVLSGFCWISFAIIFASFDTSSTTLKWLLIIGSILSLNPWILLIVTPALSASIILLVAALSISGKVFWTVFNIL